jgi:virginiamycin B lyase
MKGTNRTIAPLTRILAVAAALVALAGAVVPASSGATGKRTGRSALFLQLPWNTFGQSVAIGPEGVPWFGLESSETLSVASIQEGKLTTVEVNPGHELVDRGSIGQTGPLAFDPEGDLWFVRGKGAAAVLVRRAPDGTEATFIPTGIRTETALTVGPDGNVWFTYEGRGSRSPGIARMTPTGTVTQFPLGEQSGPTSIVAGPEGALWFAAAGTGDIGRITTAGEITLLPVGRRAYPRQVVAGPDGTLWFTENAKRIGGKGKAGKARFEDRIGRITTAGKVRQFRLPFGGSTDLLAADPSGRIWFTTQTHELASISTSGALGAHGCLDTCAAGFNAIAVAPDGTLWVALGRGRTYCGGCGGGSDLILENEGGQVGWVPPDAIRPAPLEPPSGATP